MKEKAKKEKQNDAIIKIDIVTNSQIDNSLQTDTLEEVNFNIQELELKLHISLIKEINDLVQALVSLTSDRDKILNSGIL